jgi:hypothetical protein
MHMCVKRLKLAGHVVRMVDNEIHDVFWKKVVEEQDTMES